MAPAEGKSETGTETEPSHRIKTRGGAAITYLDGRWHDGNPLVARATDHGMWLATTVFDGARALAGRAPDLDRHCARVVRSCAVMGLDPGMKAGEIESLAREGIARSPADAELYICPLFFPTEGFAVPEAASTRFVLTVQVSPLPAPSGFTACRSNFRRPAPDMAPTEAKASCLYPNITRDVADAQRRGFDVGVVLDPDGRVAEFSYANLFMVKDGTVHTPAPNGTFLDGITRQRVIRLLRGDGVAVEEREIAYDELARADELFATGNYAKVAPCIGLDGRAFAPGPVYARARALYFAFAEGA